MRPWLIIFILLSCQLYTMAQEARPAADNSSLNPKPPKTEEKNPYGALKMFSGNPGKAALYSLMIPGGGQYFNSKSERWAEQGKNNRLWKVPIVWAAEGTAIGMLVYNQRAYNSWREGHYLLATDQILDFRGITNEATVLGQRDIWERNRDYAIIGIIAVHIIQATEAFISRHLIEFDVSDDLGFKFSPVAPYPGFNLAINF